jgi:putative transcriptional regulator
MATKKHRSEALAAAHEAAKGLYRAGVIDKKTMREFDESCLTKIERISSRDIVIIRRRAGVSQGVFARYLNVPTSLVSQWERGERHPTGAAIKLLSIVKRKGLEAIE